MSSHIVKDQPDGAIPPRLASKGGSVFEFARDLLPASLRHGLRQATAGVRLQAARARVWSWRLVRLASRDGAPYELAYLGRPAEQARARELLGIVGDAVPAVSAALRSPRTALVTEAPLPGTLRVPWDVRAVVPLQSSIEGILAGYDPELRRKLRKQALTFRRRQVLDEDEIARVSRDMLEPYALARHGARVASIPSAVVRRIARGVGRLDLVYAGEEAVACHLGYPLHRAGKRYWVTLRFGYPEGVYSDQRRMRDVNSMNAHLALVWALEHGFDFYDLGSCVARPDDGLLQWKRRRGGVIDTALPGGFFYVLLPREGRAQFLWDAPLFSRERGGTVLALGLPEGPGDDEVVTRYREMGFGGLAEVRLHCAREPGNKVLDALRGLYARRGAPTPLTVSMTR